MRASLVLSLAASVVRVARSSAPNASAAFVISTNGDARNYSISRSGTSSGSVSGMIVDPEYPGTAVERMLNARARVAEIAQDGSLDGPWPEVRRKILWAGGLKDRPNAIPGQGYTGHSFNDYNHVDLTCMNDQVSDNKNGGEVNGIAIGNHLGTGIRAASMPELGPGGSWSTCANGCDKNPPQDVAHIQFRSRIAFKLVWVPNDAFDTFVLVDDDGKLLAKGKPVHGSGLPSPRQRQLNYRLVEGSKYAKAADAIAKNVAAE